MLVIKTDMTYTVTHHNDTCSPTRRDAKRSRREPQEGVRTASRSSDKRARSMSASAWRTPWTVAKPKTPAVAVRWRERRRSRPHPSRRRPTSLGTTQPKTPPPNLDNPTQPTQPNTKQPHSLKAAAQSTILKLGPQLYSCDTREYGPYFGREYGKNTRTERI